MRVPKEGLIDLHVHLDGSLGFDLAQKLAASQGMEVISGEALRARMQVTENCRNLNDYLTKFDYPLSLMQTEEAVKTSVYELLKIQASQGLVYSEIRFAPQLHRQRGLTQRSVVAAAVGGLEKYRSETGAEGMAANLILCCMRGGDNRDENMETVSAAEEFFGRGVCGLDLAGAEALFPTGNFEDVFKLAGEKNIPFTIHAGEADGPESIWKALEFGAKRIGHGVRCLEDGELVRYLAENKIPLELCPTSNMNTKIFHHISEYPLLRLMDAGIRVTVNTDNMTVSGVTVREELQLMADTFGLEEQEIGQLLRNSADSAFLADADEKQRLKMKK